MNDYASFCFSQIFVFTFSACSFIDCTSTFPGSLEGAVFFPEGRIEGLIVGLKTVPIWSFTRIRFNVPFGKLCAFKYL